MIRMAGRLASALVLALAVGAPVLAQETEQPRKYTAIHGDVGPLVSADEIQTIGEPVRVYRFGEVFALYAREYAPNRKDAVERVHRACPGLILQDHAFTDAVATLLNREDGKWGRNGKRGNRNDPSHDALFYTTTASPFGGAVIDIIGSAGSPHASVAWIDQTDATIANNTTGVWVAPSGVLPACLTGGGGAVQPKPPETSTTPPVVVQPAPVTVDNTEVLVELSRLAEQQRALAADVRILMEFVDDMVGKGPADDPSVAPNHVTDLKLRDDARRALLEQLDAWLRSRNVLRRF